MRIAISGMTLALALTGPGLPAPAAADESGARILCYDLWAHDLGRYRSVTIKNKCGATHQVKARISYWPDGPCWTVRPGGYRTDYYRSPGRFFNLTAC